MHKIMINNKVPSVVGTCAVGTPVQADGMRLQDMTIMKSPWLNLLG